MIVLALGPGLHAGTPHGGGAGDAVGGYRSITFADLSFSAYASPAERASRKGPSDPFPPRIRALNGTKVSIEGFMMPLHFQAGKVQAFYLTGAIFGCCYGDAPGILDTIRVATATGQGVSRAEFVRVRGTLEVGERLDSWGAVESAYRILADTVETRATEEGGWGFALACLGAVVLMGLLVPAVVRWIKPIPAMKA